MTIRQAMIIAIISGYALLFSSAVSAQANKNQSSWSDRVTITSAGGHAMGNPVAKFKLVEYMSYVCPRCAQFEEDSHEPLKTNFVDKGHVNFEIRHMVLNRIDLAAALLARCGPKENFFANHQAILANQKNMLDKYTQADNATKKATNQGTTNERLVKIARLVGLYDVMQKRGYKQQALTACLNNGKTQTLLTTMAAGFLKEIAPERGQTPSFTLNDKYIGNVRDWSPLETGLRRLPE